MARRGRRGRVVVLDIDYRAYSWASPSEAAAICGVAARDCDVVIGNDEEFALLAVGRGGWTWPRRWAVRVCLPCTSAGRRGPSPSRRGRIETGIFRVEALKPMGAGDGFMGG